MSNFEVRGTDVYPSWGNDRYEYSSYPVFEIRGTDVHPTVHNEHYDYTSDVAFEIRNGYAHPTYLNDDDEGFDVDSDDDVAEDSDESNWSVGEAAVALGALGAIWAGKRMWEGRKEAESLRAAELVAPPPPVPAPPPGWYPTPRGLQMWNGSSWIGPVYPAAGPVWSSTVPSVPRGPLVTSWVVTILTMGYMLPWAIAVTRRNENSAAVGWFCLIFSWTIIGWFVTLAMACAGRQRRSR